MAASISLVGTLLLIVLVQTVAPENVALGRPCRQSNSGSNYSNIWPAGNCVDGGTDGNIYNNQCAHPTSASGTRAFWQVDLGSQFPINNVEIFNRVDCCQNRLTETFIRVSDTPNGYLTAGQYTQCAYIGSEGEVDHIVVDCINGVQGRYITLYRNTNGPAPHVMNICEVRVDSGSDTVYVGGDPHVMVNAIGLDQPICFEFTGYDGAIYELVKDSSNDVVLNARIFTAEDLRQQRSYFDTAFIGHGQDSIIFTMEAVSLNGVEHSWSSLYSQSVGRLGVGVPTTDTIVVDVEEGIQITINRKMNEAAGHLNIFMSKTNGLSESTTGLIGEFLFKEASVEQLSSSSDEGQLLFSSTGRSASATISHRHTMAGARTSCWEVTNDQVDNIMNNSISSYMISRLDQHQL